MNTELLSLLKNPKLSQKSKEELARKVGKYLKNLNAEQKTEIKALLNERSDLLKKLKSAQNKKKA